MIIAVKDPLTRTSYQKELITAGEITAEDLVAEFRLTAQDFKKQGKFLYHNNWCKVLLGQGEECVFNNTGNRYSVYLKRGGVTSRFVIYG